MYIWPFKISCPITPTNICLLYVKTVTSEELRLPVLFSLHLEGVLQPIQQLVGELAHILLLRKTQRCKMTNYKTAFGTWRSQSQTTGLDCTYKQESPISQINAMSVICWYTLNSGYEMTCLSGGVHRFLNFKGNLHALRPLSHRHQCQLVIQVNAYPTWLIHMVVTWLMSAEAIRLTSVNLRRDTGLVWMLTLGEEQCGFVYLTCVRHVIGYMHKTTNY